MIFSLSAAAFASASLTIRSTSSLGNVEAPLIVIDCCLLVALSFAVTERIPFASISNVTSICGTPLAAGAIPSNLKVPRLLLSFASSLSPCKTWISTLGWLSTAVENVSDFFVGIIVFLGVIFVVTPPKVSTPRDNGVTSNNKMSLTSPPNTPACTAAPTATTSSGFTDWFGVLPRSFSTNF